VCESMATLKIRCKECPVKVECVTRRKEDLVCPFIRENI
jgi:hypothetical protein